jgi:drug/metabolite transporter (DMT)-like permease
MVWSTVAALAAAALFAGTTNLQRVAASRVAPTGTGPLHLVRRLVADTHWLIAGVIGVVALGLHALALALGGVMVVQSVMALGLLLALAVEAIRERRRLRPREVSGAVLVMTGVAVVVTLARPGRPPGSLDAPTLIACTLLVAAALAAVVRSRREVGRRWGARLLAAGAGACFAVDAVFLQQLAAPVHALAGRPGAAVDVAGALVGLVGFLTASAVGGVAVHRAYQVAPLRSVQPCLAATEPVTAFLLGVGVLGEGVTGGAAGFVLLVAGVVAIAAGIVVGLAGPRRAPRVPGMPAPSAAERPVPAASVGAPGARLVGSGRH